MGHADKIESKSKLISAALAVADDYVSETHRLPGPHDDAQSELLDERLLISAREYVEAHKDETPIGG